MSRWLLYALCSVFNSHTGNPVDIPHHKEWHECVVNHIQMIILLKNINSVKELNIEASEQSEWSHPKWYWCLCDIIKVQLTTARHWQIFYNPSNPQWSQMDNSSSKLFYKLICSTILNYTTVKNLSYHISILVTISNT